MNKNSLIPILTLAALYAPAAHSQVAQNAPVEYFDIAITVDDLPAHGKLPLGMTRLGIAEAHLRALKEHKVPEAFGFVNASHLKSEPGTEAVLDLWRKSAYPLGNHTYSHMNLEKAVSLDAWKADVIAGEDAVSSRMAGADWHFLRLPNLSAGSTNKEAALTFLRERHYRIADVSLAFGDWNYTDAYVRCVAKGDNATIDRMKQHYLDGVDLSIANMKLRSKQVYGRIIPQVLLTHIGGWSAVTLPDVLARLEVAGAHFVSLAQAQSDPAYAEPGGGSVIPRAARQKGIRLASAPATENMDLNIKSLCR